MGEAKKHTWPGWETVGIIGKGNYGTVYEIQRDVFGDVEKAALKVISIPKNKSDIEEFVSEGYDRDSISSTFKGYMQRIAAEYSLARKMSGNSNIVSCDDVLCEPHEDGIGWDVYIKMELLTPLTKALPINLDEETVLTVGKDICAALVLCKKYDIVHRDIKPENIFLSPNGDYKLGDFGIAKTIDKTTGGTKAGTPKYMSPEVYYNKPYGSGADIYSLGIVLYWLLNEHRIPFLPLPPQTPNFTEIENAIQFRLNGKPIPAPKNGSTALKEIVLKACAYKPEDRYQSAKEMYEALCSIDLRSSKSIEENSCKLESFDDHEGAWDETVGPMSARKEQSDSSVDNLSNEQQSEEDGTIGPDWKKKEKKKTAAAPVRPRKKEKKWVIPVILGVIALFLFSMFMREYGPAVFPDAFKPDGPNSGLVTEPPATEAPKIAVSTVLGKTKDVAESELVRLGFKVEFQYTKSDTTPEGCVVVQEPKSGTQLTKGATVFLTISSGKPTIFVADVVGKSKSEAEALLKGQGFQVSFVEEYSTNVAKGAVARQSPSAGSGQFSGTKIVVAISKGPEPMTLVFDSKGGTATEKNRTVYCGKKFGALPTAEKEGFTFGGWYFADGVRVTADTAVTEAKTLNVYAKWNAVAYSIQWNEPTGCIITVKRTSSPNGGAAVATLSSGSTIYYGDVLSVTYTPETGYSIGSKGSTSITVKGNVTSSNIYATTTVNAYKASWSNGTGYSVTVKRTSSPYAGASTGALSSGSTVYFGDVLAVSYEKQDYYTVGSHGQTSITVTGNVTSSHIYATATLNPTSGWVLKSNVPAGALLVDTKWTYTRTQTTESTSSYLSGWTQKGSYWKQTGSGSTNYASFPSGYDTNNKYYKEFAKAPYSAYDDGSTKREVTNTWAGYIYWHWMYNCHYANRTDRTIANARGTYPDTYGYYYFYAIASTVDCRYLSHNYSWQSQASYNCHDIIPQADKNNGVLGLGTPRFYRFDYYTSSYVDYERVYQYQKVTTGLESRTQVYAGGEISNVQEYVMYCPK